MGIEYALKFTFVLVRVAGVFLFLPVLGERTVPATVKVLSIMALAIALYPVVHAELPPVEIATTPLILMGVAEVLYGILIGMGASVIFGAISVSGQFVGRNMGMAMAIGADPLSGVQTTAVGNICNAVGVLVFFAMDGHLAMISAIRDSFACWPLGRFIDPSMGREIAVSAVAESFSIAFQIAAPLLVMTFAMTLIMALMARLAPAMNVMLFGFSLRIMVGLIGLALFMPSFVQCSGQVVRTAVSFSEWIVHGGTR